MVCWWCILRVWQERKRERSGRGDIKTEKEGGRKKEGRSGERRRKKKKDDEEKKNSSSVLGKLQH